MMAGINQITVLAAGCQSPESLIADVNEVLDRAFGTAAWQITRALVLPEHEWMLYRGSLLLMLVRVTLGISPAGTTSRRPPSRRWQRDRPRRLVHGDQGRVCRPLRVRGWDHRWLPWSRISEVDYSAILAIGLEHARQGDPLPRRPRAS